MKRAFTAILAGIILCMSLTACGSKRELAQTVVENAIKSVQTADLEAISNYWGGTEVSESDAQTEALMKLLGASLTYEVKSSAEDEKAGTATVAVSFTNIDMSKVMTDFLSEMFSIAMEYAFLPTDQQPSEDELSAIYMDKLTELIGRDDNGTVTNEVEISLSLSDDKWVIVPEENALNAMYGGMFSAVG